MIPLFRRFLSRPQQPGSSPVTDIWSIISDLIEQENIADAGSVFAAFKQIQTIFHDEETSLYYCLRLLALQRSRMLQQRVLQTVPANVQGGPFQGMQLLPSSKEGCYLPKLFGTYESALHDEIARILEADYTTIINIGCGDGYYAVGFALLMPNAAVIAIDISAEERKKCLEMAQINGVEHRISIQTAFTEETLGQCNPMTTFILCDIEGSERELLDPERIPALRRTDMLVETHRLQLHHSREILNQRFDSSHDIRWIEFADNICAPSPLIQNVEDELDQFLLTWEWRVENILWAVMKNKQAKR